MPVDLNMAKRRINFSNQSDDTRKPGRCLCNGYGHRKFPHSFPVVHEPKNIWSPETNCASHSA